MSRRGLCAGSGAVALLGAALASAYPLEGYETTGIRRLLGIRLAQEGLVRDSRQPSGARLGLAEVDLRLLDRRDFDPPAPDPDLTRRVTEMLGAEAERYSVALLDLSDAASPRYAEHRGTERQNVGSVGKLVVALALFQALADTWPDVETAPADPAETRRSPPTTSRRPTTTRCASSTLRRRR